MNKIRVLQFSITNTGGGITQYILNNWKYIDRKRFQFDFVTFSPKLDYEDELLAEGCKIYHIKKRAEDNLDDFNNEIKQVLENQYDVIHLHTNFWKSLEMEKLAKEANVSKIIIHAHNSGIYEDKEGKGELEQHNYIKEQINEGIATDFWACSWKAAEFLYGNRIPRQKIKIMKNAIALDMFKFSPSIRNIYRKKMGIDNCFVIGHVGRFSKEKNHSFLIDVFRDICSKRQDARLMLIGKGTLEDEIKAQIKRYGIEDRVLLLGKRKDVYFLYNAMDVFCFPSHYEGLGMALIEAQANGLICIGSDNIPQEAVIEDITQVRSLEKSKWVEMLLNGSWERKHEGIEMLQRRGYDIREQIKTVENEYSKL